MTTREPLLDAWRRWQGRHLCLATGRNVTAPELRAVTDRLSGDLARCGVLAGDTVALRIGNGPEFETALFAVLALGANPLLLHSASRGAELADAAAHAGARWSIVQVGSDVPDGWAHTDVVVGRLAALEGPAALSVARLAGVVLHPTSGTSGLYRACVRGQDVAIAEGENYLAAMPAYGETRVVLTTPLSHAFAFGFGLVSALLAGATLVTDREFNPKKLLSYLARHPPGVLTLVPPMVRPLCHLRPAVAPDLALGLAFYAGANLDEAARVGFESEFRAPLHAIYGSTETGAISTTFTPSGRSAGVGVPLPGVRVKLRRQAEFHALGGGSGEVFVRSTSMMQGYLGAVEPAGAWFAPGDIGRVDEAGALHLRGRTRDIINVSGLKVDPFEVEAVLASHPAVRDVAVYPGPTRGGEEIVLAAVAVSAGVTEDELRGLCAGRLAPFRVPSRIHLVPEIPRTASGKCLRHRLPGAASPAEGGAT